MVQISIDDCYTVTEHVARDVHVPVFLAGLGEGWPSLMDADRTLPGRGCGQNTHE